MFLYRTLFFVAALAFAAVGLLFLFGADLVLTVFNALSGYFDMPPAALQATNFYLGLASAYMYLVALLAFLSYRHPEERIYPMLLVQGKLASALLSLYLFCTHQPYLIYLANFLLDGVLAGGTWLLSHRAHQKRYNRFGR